MRIRGAIGFLSVLSLVGALLTGGGVVHAAANTCTWVGGGSDAKFSTTANWSCTSGTVPVDGDAIVLNGGATLTSGTTLVNDLSNVHFSGVTLDSTPTGTTDVIFSIDTLPMADGAIIDRTAASDNVYLEAGTISSVGSLTNNSAFGISIGTLNVPGTYIIKKSSYDMNQSGTIGTVELGPNSSLYVRPGTTKKTYAQAIHFAGTSAQPNSVYISGQQKCPTNYTSTSSCTDLASEIVLSGQLTLDSNVNLLISSSLTEVSATLRTLGPGKFVYDPYSEGYMTVNGAKMPYAKKTTNISCSAASNSFTVARNEVATLKTNSNCAYGNVMIDGVLKGNGKITTQYGGSLNINTGGTIAPGNSPGCITTDSLRLAGTYQFEFAGSVPCKGYDQLVITNFNNKTTYDTTNGPLILTSSSKLVVSQLANYTPTKGQVFTIIDNQSKYPVIGTFSGLPEGTQFVVNGIVFRISYKGGNGNDITLTVMNVPKVPNTGFTTIKANPLVTLGGVLAIIAGVVLFVRRAQSKR